MSFWIQFWIFIGCRRVMCLEVSKNFPFFIQIFTEGKVCLFSWEWIRIFLSESVNFTCPVFWQFERDENHSTFHLCRKLLSCRICFSLPNMNKENFVWDYYYILVFELQLSVTLFIMGSAWWNLSNKNVGTLFAKDDMFDRNFFNFKGNEARYGAPHNIKKN